MDELWQRYRTFWTPVLIGVGVFLVGVIGVHIASKDPDRQKALMSREQGILRQMKRPERGIAQRLKERTASLEAQVDGWAQRLDTTRSAGDRLLEEAVDRALRAAFLRGASDAEARSAQRLAARFEDDEVAAERAWRRFSALKEQHIELLRSGDPNVAFGRLLSEVWSTLRVRANRADMEIADTLGFATVASVNRATLPARALTLALVADIADQAIRGGMNALDGVRIEPNVKPGQPTDFLTEWPVGLSMEGPYGAVLAVLSHLTRPDQPEVLTGVLLTQPRGRTGRTPDGLVRLEMNVAATVVRPAVDLGLDREAQ